MKSSSSTVGVSGSFIPLALAHLGDLLSYLTGTKYTTTMLQTWTVRDRKRVQKWCDREIKNTQRLFPLRTRLLPGVATRVIVNLGRGNCSHGGRGDR